MQKLLTFFWQKYVYAIFNDQSFNDTLTYNIISFEQLSPVFFPLFQTPSENVSCKQNPFWKGFMQTKPFCKGVCSKRK